MELTLTIARFERQYAPKQRRAKNGTLFLCSQLTSCNANGKQYRGRRGPAQGKEPHRAALLGDYLDNFSNTYQERMDEENPAPPDFLVRLAFKLLIDLLFYGANNGHRRLWLALVDHATT